MGRRSSTRRLDEMGNIVDVDEDEINVVLPEGPIKEGVKFGEEAVKAANRSKTALLLIDLQNEFGKEGGKLHQDVKEVMESTEMLSKIPKVMATARKVGALLIHSPVIMKDKEKFDVQEFDVNEYSKMKGLFVENTWNAKFLDECKPEPEDIILINRKSFSAFEGTGLKEILEGNGIRRVFLMGFLSNGCIDDTALAMREKCPDIEIFICTDGSAAKSAQDHLNATTVSLPLYGTCITCQEAMERLTAKSLGRISDVESTGGLGKGYRPRILALCGARSNNDVTKLQLENLHITEETHDITYLQGTIQVEEGDPELAGLVHGPFYSWLEDDKDKLGDSIIESVRYVLGVIKANGPFHGIYGFSSGALVASFVAGINRDPALQERIVQCPANRKRKSSILSSLAGYSPVGRGRRASPGLPAARRASSKNFLAMPSQKGSMFRRGSRFSVASGTVDVGQLDLNDLQQRPFHVA